MRGLVFSLLVLNVLSACATTQDEAATPSVYYAKPQMTAERYRADQVACLETAHATQNEDSVGIGPAASVVSSAIGLAGAPFGLAASAVVALISYGGKAHRESAAQTSAVDCLENKGYELREFDEQQTAELDRLEGSAQTRRALEMALSDAADDAPVQPDAASSRDAITTADIALPEQEDQKAPVRSRSQPPVLLPSSTWD